MMPIAELLYGAFPSLITGGRIAVLWGYFDESGTDGQLGVTAISGFAAPLNIWSQLEHRWQAALREDGISCFHNVQCRNRSGEYKEWDISRSAKHLEKMAEILTDSRLVAISAVHSGDFKSVSKMHPETSIRFPTAYSLCFELAVEALLKACRDRNENIAVVMSDQLQFKSRVVEVYDHFKFNGHWQNIEGLSFSDPKSLAPLQAADMFAYETRRYTWKSDLDYWKQQPFLSRWLPLVHSGDRIVYDIAINDEGLNGILAQKTTSFLKATPKQEP